MNDLQISVAILQEAENIALLLRSSISSLCALDHKNDDVLIAKWIENKTAENVEIWLQSPVITFVVGEIFVKLAGVGCFSERGEVILN